MVPDGWHRSTLGSIANAVTSGSRDWAQYYSGTGAKFIRMTNLRREGIELKLDELKYVNVTSTSADGRRTKLQPNDILISITAELGKIGWVPPDLGEAYINQHTALVRIASKRAHPKFIAYLLASSPLNKQINRMNDSGAKAGLNLPTVKSISLTLPPIIEQRKIEQILSTWDDAIRTTENLIENSQRLKKGLMQTLLRPSDSSQGWKKYKLSDVAQILVSNVDKKSSHDEESVRLCNYTDVYYNDYITAELELMEATATKAQLEKFGIQKGDILITKDSETPDDIAVPSLVDDELEGVVCGYHLAIIRPKADVDGAYLRSLFSLDSMQHYFFTRANGATRFGLTIDAIRDAVFTLPSLEQQRERAKIIQGAERVVYTYHENLELLRREKKALMQQLLTGKRRVRVDEPVESAYA